MVMGILERTGKVVQQDRSRDIMGKIKETTNRGDNVDEIITSGMRDIVATDLDADQYGKRRRYEHEEIVLSNEYLAMASHIDSVMSDLSQRHTALMACATKLKENIRDKVIQLTVLVTAEKAVVADLDQHFKALASRITETRNAQFNPASGGNGNGSVRTNGGGEPHVGEEPQHASDEEGAR